MGARRGDALAKARSVAKHTPGPWFAETSENYTLGGDGIEITTHDADGMIDNQIAWVGVDSGAGRAADLKRIAVAEVDAHLIATAPDLLAFAHRVAEHFAGTDAPLGQAALGLILKAEGR